jgi:hypothetical protein
MISSSARVAAGNCPLANTTLQCACEHAGEHTSTRSSNVKKTQAKGIRIQAKTAKCKNGENRKFMADSGSMQQSSKLATGRYCNSVRTARTIGQNTSEVCCKKIDVRRVAGDFVEQA